MLLDGLRAGTPLPIAPLSPDELHEAITTHKQRVLRAAKAAAR